MKNFFLAFILLLSGIITTAICGTELQAGQTIEKVDLRVYFPDSDNCYLIPKVKKLICINKSGEERIITTTWTQVFYKSIEQYTIAEKLPLKDTEGNFLIYKIEYIDPFTHEETWVMLNVNGITLDEDEKRCKIAFVFSYQDTSGKKCTNNIPLVIDETDSSRKIDYSSPFAIVVPLINRRSFVYINYYYQPLNIKSCGDWLIRRVSRSKASRPDYESLPE